ncbi:hypothetical protein MACK_002926 [Theileria orientalis]|uniref:Uncharacterized protein n=1 Tax=Theileria orientalis TaxID=68886 RepID=A0A976MDV0_THEOR|nr:hypothetical protein MACK_002926 [Theileria orientalis]
MTGVVCDHFSSCLVTPQQTLPNNFQTTGSNGFANCVSHVPSQQSGFIVGNSYNFSEGFSIDPCCNVNTNPFSSKTFTYNNSDFNYDGNYNFSNDYSFHEGLNMSQDMFNQTNPDGGMSEYAQFERNLAESELTPKRYISVTATRIPPEALGEDEMVDNLTPSFFASNRAFKRININSGRSIFRKRRPGDCKSEWSNAFDKYCETGLYGCDE